jgi:hypothetical protein
MPGLKRRLFHIVFLLGMAVWLGYEDVRCPRFALMGGSVAFVVLANNERRDVIEARRQQRQSDSATRQP